MSKITDILMIKMDDNKYDGHEGSKWICNGKTYLWIRSDQHTNMNHGHIDKEGKYHVFGMPFVIDNSMDDGEIKLIN